MSYSCSIPSVPLLMRFSSESESESEQAPPQFQKGYTLAPAQQQQRPQSARVGSEQQDKRQQQQQQSPQRQLHQPPGQGRPPRGGRGGNGAGVVTSHQPHVETGAYYPPPVAGYGVAAPSSAHMGPAHMPARQPTAHEAYAAAGGAAGGYAPPEPLVLSHLSSTSFASLPLSPETQRAMHEVLGFEYLTLVQAATLPVIMQGVDVMAKAKTGTGKTMAFLIPCIEALRASPPRGGISTLVLSPTRELALQIAKEATAALTYHPLKVDCMYGGTNINAEKKRLGSRIDFLVATPGRLIDHLENTAGLQQLLSGIRFLVMDEADHLLEMGFRPAIERILSFLPPQRQTLLFSATIPAQVHQVAGLALRRGFQFVDTVSAEDAGTNVQVEQFRMIVPFESHLAVVYALIQQHRSTPGYKIIAFFPTARVTQLLSEMLIAAGVPVFEIHSRKSQPQRERASAAFREAREGVLFSSDVSARGVDYPDVSFVLQVGLPSSREQYIHRLGRTARAGKQGQGLLLLAPFEEHFVRELRDLPVTSLPAATPSAGDHAVVARALAAVDVKSREQAYQAWLGFYNGQKMGWDKAVLVQHANWFAQIMLLPGPPALAKKTVGMMGLKGVPGLVIDDTPYAGGGGRAGDGGGGGRGGGGSFNGGRGGSGGAPGGGSGRGGGRDGRGRPSSARGPY